MDALRRTGDAQPCTNVNIENLWGPGIIPSQRLDEIDMQMFAEIVGSLHPSMSVVNPEEWNVGNVFEKFLAHESIFLNLSRSERLVNTSEREGGRFDVIKTTLLLVQSCHLNGLNSQFFFKNTLSNSFFPIAGPPKVNRFSAVIYNGNLREKTEGSEKYSHNGAHQFISWCSRFLPQHFHIVVFV
jgi:hypothetical protein